MLVGNEHCIGSFSTTLCVNILALMVAPPLGVNNNFTCCEYMYNCEFFGTRMAIECPSDDMGSGSQKV